MDNVLSSGVGVILVVYIYVELYLNLIKLFKGLVILLDLVFQIIIKEIGSIFEIVELIRFDYEVVF